MLLALLLFCLPAGEPRPSGQIAFMRGGKVCIANVADGKVQELTGALRYEADRSITWSLDGKNLLYWNHSPIGWDIWSIPGAGGQGRNLTNVKTGGCRSPAFSADGKHIAFMRDDPAGVYVMDAEGAKARRLTDKGHRDDPPAWSPDGKRLAFMDRSADNHFDLYVVDADGKNETRLVRGGSEPMWLPDGRLLFLRQLHGARLAIYDFKNKQESLLTDTTESVADPVLSSDGEWIAFLTGRGEKQQLTVVDSTGKQRKELTLVEGSVYREITWSPDSRWLAFISGPRDKTALFVIGRDGKGLRKLVDGEPHFPAWRPR